MKQPYRGYFNEEIAAAAIGREEADRYQGVPPVVQTPLGATATVGNQGKYPDGSWKPSI